MSDRPTLLGARHVVLAARAAAAADETVRALRRGASRLVLESTPR